MAAGKLEGRIKVPAGGWGGSLVEDGGGAVAPLIAAGSVSYWSSEISGGGTFLEQIEAAFEAVSPGGLAYTASLNSAGVLKLAVQNGHTFALVWGDTDFRDVCGFAGNITTTGEATADYQVRNLWLADGACKRPRPAGDSGTYESDARGLFSAAGHGSFLSGFRRRVLSVEWEAAKQARGLIVGESTTNESFERFWLDVIQGSAWCGPGGPLRYYWDEAVDATYLTASPRGAVLSELPVRQTDDRHYVIWNIGPVEFVEVPA